MPVRALAASRRSTWRGDGFKAASLSSSGLQFEFINPIFEFSKGMNDLHLDEAEYALLIAINIFSAGQVSSLLVCSVILPSETRD